ncbi:endonuclease/exonuclease/phosphatase family protein [Enterovibrio baiacu]|uniref:endonuclease/exonuclease/phosphatase family protein n=1 Tax=Enterovibrio baiacu TaxID=2491023 RepID=UPI003D0DDDA7
MKMRKWGIALLFSALTLMGCKHEKVTVASFNLSFDRGTFEQLVDEMKTSRKQQRRLVDAYVNDKDGMSDEERERAEKIIQIRNVAAIIQTTRPDILMMGEFNNDGNGIKLKALKGFQKNYLSHGQSPNSIDGGDRLKPIKYPFKETYATNTGLNSGLDLDNNGDIGQLPGDAWGFGFYHGQYAFALMSTFEIDKKRTRTFQTFKWKDLPNAENPRVVNCDDPNNPIPEGLGCGDEWYLEQEWQRMRLSSKNHVDVPIKVSTPFGDDVVHLLLSHPTPPVFDTVTENNKLRNRDEIQFWIDYIDDAGFIYDDKGKVGGLSKKAHFVVMGDLNADPLEGDGFQETIGALLSHPRVNQTATEGNLTPTSTGALEANNPGQYPERVTSTFGLRVDHVIPSAGLHVTESGVYWPASGEKGRLLMNDERVGQYGDGKDISSDHRLVWNVVELY